MYAIYAPCIVSKVLCKLLWNHKWRLYRVQTFCCPIFFLSYCSKFWSVTSTVVIFVESVEVSQHIVQLFCFSSSCTVFNRDVSKSESRSKELSECWNGGLCCYRYQRLTEIEEQVVMKAVSSSTEEDFGHSEVESTQRTVELYPECRCGLMLPWKARQCGHEYPEWGRARSCFENTRRSGLKMIMADGLSS